MIETRDRDLLERLLRREEVWAGYGLGDLDDVHFPRTRWLLSDPEGAGVVLLYAVGGHATVLTYGQAGPVAEVFAQASLPESFDVHLPDPHLELLRPLFVGELVPHVRLAVRPDELRAVAAPDGAESVALGPDDLAAAEALYRHYPGNWFDARRLAEGCYLGVRLHGELVAIGGTHVVSSRTRVAALGDIVTAPSCRGRGVGAFLTHALCTTLWERADLVVLNVASDNAAARRAYEKVGFAHAVPHQEGHHCRQAGSE